MSLDLDKMPHNAAYHLCLHCLSKYVLYKGLRLAMFCTHKSSDEHALNRSLARAFVARIPNEGSALSLLVIYACGINILKSKPSLFLYSNKVLVFGT